MKARKFCIAFAMAFAASGVAHAENFPLLFCTNDKGEHVPFKGHETVKSFTDEFYEKFHYSLLPFPNDDEPNQLFLIYFEEEDCPRLTNGLCENFNYTMDVKPDGSEFYMVRMSVNFQNQPEEVYTGNEMCWRTWSILNSK